MSLQLLSLSYVCWTPCSTKRSTRRAHQDAQDVHDARSTPRRALDAPNVEAPRHHRPPFDLSARHQLPHVTLYAPTCPLARSTPVDDDTVGDFRRSTARLRHAPVLISASFSPQSRRRDRHDNANTRRHRQSPSFPMEHYAQTESYELGNGGSLVFERDLYLVSEKLERPPPQFHGVRIHNTPGGEQQHATGWTGLLTPFRRDLLGCADRTSPHSGNRFAHFARHDTMGEPMALSSHPVLKHHVEHLDFMLHETRKDLELTRVHAHRAQMALAHHADAIRLLAKDRRSLRLQRAKKDATITRLREKIRTLEVTVRTQQDQIQEMEEDGEDIQGGDDFLSDDNDFEDDEFTDEEDYEFLESEEDGIIPIDVDEDDEE
ncbi:hypothetical protein QYE76_053225 [Lolium multiflorum]|uniref:Uncharacterized protein n=1 Tax=Lolium multiflorum TaxID=4521 RepID=A0AAD8WK81_LOLMU|nr:hypothetical protein QYE76_053225 [Lolium multiflorum]